MPITELPFGLPGRVFRSPMPFSVYDPEGDLVRQFKANGVSVVFLLAEQDECLRKAGCDLRFLYGHEGFAVVHQPIPNYGVPSDTELEAMVTEAVERARSGHNIAIHCLGGMGRTGTVLAGMAVLALGMAGDEAIAWVRRYIPHAVETEEQERVVARLAARSAARAPEQEDGGTVSVRPAG